MAAVMSTGGEEPALVLAKYLADLAWADAGEEVAGPAVAQAVNEATKLLSATRIQDLLTLLFITADTVLPKATPQDVESILSVLISLVPLATTPEEVEASAVLVANKLAGVPAENAALKLRLLFLLHNGIPASSPARYEVLLRIVRAASEGGPKLAEAVLPNLRRLDLAQQPWWPRLSTEQKRQLYLALTAMLRDHVRGKAKSELMAFSLKYLALFSAQEAREHADIRAIAAAAALDFLRAPDVFESDLLDVPAVHALQSDPQHSTLYQLLSIFLSARLADYTAFREAQPTALQTLGLVHADCEAKMRLLSIAAAAADSLSAAAAAASAAAGPSGAGVGAASPGLGEIRYAVLQDSLALDDELAVEKWVVKAISAGLVGAKMDQRRQTVVVSRASYRVFGSQQWQELRGRLVTWKENVASVSRVAHQVRAMSAEAAAAPAAAQGAVVA